ncbi:NAD(P)-dependent oxidoreductase [Psychromarinibacter sp. C21-152]|uniref:NAD(P)-dependent oxidoreductase n=1 Tax=Psychromarinibacter sediminicola TaxID=3033385 RepID=A0AAE3T850_9RHOB|nr:NAD(P)-dependent oxidoreductase [Psychromarinibacter sediminicola]MDF0599724.1 NAD(P)-dependent oxidoreductase [Psychromarinibacter sediminicola]
MDMKIGFLGAGLMGEGMAVNLALHHVVATWLHRNRQTEPRLKAAGIDICDSQEDLATSVDALFLCLPNADLVAEVLTRLAPAMRSGTLVVDTTTSLPDTSRDMAAMLAEHGIDFIDAPVTGGPQHAMARELNSLVGGSEGLVEKATPLLECYSKGVFHFGPTGAGHAAKLINNFITQGQSALTIEAMRRCRAVNVDMKMMYDVISTSDSRSGTYMKVMEGVIAGTYDTHRFSLANAAKDARYAAHMFAEAGVPSRMSEGMLKFYAEEEQDWPGDTFLSGLMRERG